MSYFRDFVAPVGAPNVKGQVKIGAVLKGC